ncbi:protein disulfide-isomerase A4-like isoform X2 [Lineus longissimus]|uniref:protein disulfide-isomerase A4-like isoform X2 n=1 Tax=Lineus longissimus TaxID=88925 RepID=UPI002B4F4C6B
MKFSSKLVVFLCLGFLFSIATVALAEGQDGGDQGDQPSIKINFNDPNFDPKLAAAEVSGIIKQQVEEITGKKIELNSRANAKDDVKLDIKEEVKEEDDVLVLTKDNFDAAIAKNDVILVEFYAPWCGHCKSLAPEYAKAAKELKTNTPPVSLAKVDATVESELGTRFSVSGYPTLKFFVKGKDYDYDGPREANGIVDYMKARAEPSWEPPKSAVAVLTKDNFTNWINEKNLALVEFYAPWCGHCKQLEPHYEKAATSLLQNDPPIPLAKVDATVEGDLAKQYSVDGFPTLKIFRNGKAFDYNGPREEYGIFDYMIKQVGDASKEVKSLKVIRESFGGKKTDISVVGFFESDKDKEYDVFTNAANNLREDFKFLHTFDSSLRDNFKVNAGSVVVFNAERFYTKFENKWHVFDKLNPKVEEIESFIREHQVPLVSNLNRKRLEKRFTKRPLCVVFYTVDFSFDHIKATQLWRLKIAEIAKDFRDITFAVADEDGMSTMFRDFKFDDSGEDMNIGCFDEKEKKYPMAPMEDGFDSSEIRAFLKKFKDGELKPMIKSQPVPKKQGNVKVVVGKSFEDIVNDKTKDALIEFYAPWCGHCKSLAPIYDKMAKELSSEKNLVIAKIDSTANDAPGQYEVSGFPTIYFAPSNNKDNPIKFEGERDADGMKKFMKEHATVSFGKSAKEEL